MKTELLKLLKELEQEIPPDIGHHSLTFASADEQGTVGEDRLVLSIRVNQGQRAFFLEEQDFSKSAAEVAAEIRYVMSL